MQIFEMKRMMKVKNHRMKRTIIVMLCMVLVLSGVFLFVLQKEPEIKMIPEAHTEPEQPDAEMEDVPVEIEYVDKTPLVNLDDLEPGTLIQKERIVIENLDQYFTYGEIEADIYERILGKSYPENARISLDELRYLKLLHYNYDHEIQVGELIVNRQIAQNCVDIFRELFELEYEIESMRLIDNYWTGDAVDSDTNSISNNNTSAFNYRTVPGTTSLSKHAKGLAIDVNPLQNPYVTYNSDGSFARVYKDMELYLDRDSGKEHMITHQDACFKIFKKYGFTWGGDWNSMKDYQHFQK